MAWIQVQVGLVENFSFGVLESSTQASQPSIFRPVEVDTCARVMHERRICTSSGPQERVWAWMKSRVRTLRTEWIHRLVEDGVRVTFCGDIIYVARGKGAPCENGGPRPVHWYNSCSMDKSV
jgi:hypothetical protein